jgi:hypothetical protein
MHSPCPWTGYCADDDLLSVIIKEAREGSSPDDIVRAVEAEANELEFYEDGRVAP